MASGESSRTPALRDALVAEARAMIEREGFAAFNLRALTQRLGVTQPAVYRHFESRDALLGAVMVAGFRDFDAAAVDTAGDDEPYGRLHRLGAGYVRFGAANPGWFRLTFGRRGAQASIAADLGDASRGQFLTLSALARIVPPDHADFGPSYRAWWGLAHGLTFLTVEGVFSLVASDAARVDAAERAIASHLAGLRAHWGEAGPPTSHTFAELFARLAPR